MAKYTLWVGLALLCAPLILLVGICFVTLIKVAIGGIDPVNQFVAAGIISFAVGLAFIALSERIR